MSFFARRCRLVSGPVRTGSISGRGWIRCRWQTTQAGGATEGWTWTTLVWGLSCMGVGAGLNTFLSARSSTTTPTPPTTTNTPPAKERFGSPADFQQAISELRRTFAELGEEDKVSTDPGDLETHGFSNWDYHPGELHSVIVYPTSTSDVVSIVRIADKFRVPVVPYAGGTSLEGHCRGVSVPSLNKQRRSVGGICIDMTRMDQILSINEKDSDMVVQPGVGWMGVNEVLREKGIPLFFPLDPGPGATIGGMLSTGCSGTNAVRYGTARAEWFLNATIILPNGTTLKTRQRARKSAAGPDLTKLFVGAEGTLGVVTEVTIRLAPLLPTRVATVQFPNVHAATEATREIINKGVGIQCIELVDALGIRALNSYGMSARKRPERDCLFIKFQGHDEDAIVDSAGVAQEICASHSGTDFEFARSQEEADNLWSDRKNILFAGLNLIPGSRGWSTDVCVPVSRLPDLVHETQRDLQNIGLTCMVCGHVGDGNFHALLLFENDEELDVARGAVHRMVERAIGMEGTCTGEHGIGIGKKQYLLSELGPGTIELLKTIKRAVDPKGLFNPGKLYPDEEDEEGYGGGGSAVEVSE